MTFALLVIGIILSAIASLVLLIFSIIFLAKRKHRKGGLFGIGFIVTVSIAVLCIIEAVRLGKLKIQEGRDWVLKNSVDLVQSSGNYYGYAPSWVTDTIPAGYFEKCGDDMDCIPLVYPYRFLPYDPLATSASLERFDAVPDSLLNEIKFITGFSFDTLFLLAKRNNNEMMQSIGKENKLPDCTYFLLDFRTGKCEVFMNEERLLSEASKRGYSGEQYLSPVYYHQNTYLE